MDYFINCQNESRPFPASFPVSGIGWIPRKRSEVNNTFTTINFSFILAGRGYYYVGDKKREVEAPCVITQYPGVKCRYGPYDYWSELYIIFHASLVPEFERRNIYSENLRLWKTGELEPLLELKELSDQVKNETSLSMDLYDRVAEKTLVQSLIKRSQPKGSPLEECLKSFKQAIRSSPANPPELSEFCREAGMSTSSFRRAWAKSNESSPHQYLTDIRLQIARKRLLESAESISNIAYGLGFEDPLYFSRVFSKANGVSPREFRKINLSFSAQLNR